MARLILNLQEGFRDDDVVVKVNGQEEYHKEHVKTNYAIGLADRVTVDDLEGVVLLEIALPGRAMQRQQELNLMPETYVAVSIHEGEIELDVTDEPPYFL